MLSLEYMNFVEQNEKKLNERDPRLGLPFAVYPWSSSLQFESVLMIIGPPTMRKIIR
jgi:hypothetical protein